MKAALFIGWGDVLKYYLPHLKRYFCIVHDPVSGLDLIFPPSCPDHHTGYIAEAAAKAGMLHSPSVHAWDGPSLEGLISNGVIDTFFLLTPPSLHLPQVVRILELVPETEPVSIFIEKPLGDDLASIIQCLQLIDKDYPDRRDCIHCIDHYTQKWAVDCFRKSIRYQGSGCFDRIGKLREIVFASFEKQPIWPSTAFNKGYAREHAPHAIAMIRRLSDAFSGAEIVVDDQKPARFWRYPDCDPSCPLDSSFLLPFRIRFSDCPVAESVPFTVAGGKGLERDVKKLFIRGDRADFVAHFNRDKAFVREDLKSAGLDTPRDKPAPHEKIISGIFGPAPDVRGVTISLDDALVALDRIEKAVARFERTGGKPAKHDKNTTPKELAEIETSIP